MLNRFGICCVYKLVYSQLDKDVQTYDPTKIVWTRATRNNRLRRREYKFNAVQIVESIYRPFCKMNLYYDRDLNEEISLIAKIFPTSDNKNFLICLPDKGNKNFSVMIVDKIPCYDFMERGQCFPLYYYELSTQGGLFGEENVRRDGISDFILREARKRFGDVIKEDIFYYVYGFLHLPSYREKFSAELKKSLPRFLLTNTNLSVAEISSSLGWLNPENFIRSFQKEFGLTPAKYRKNNKI